MRQSAGGPASGRRNQKTEPAPGVERNRIARDSYSILHLPMVAGIVLVALGMKKTLEHVEDPLKLVPAVALLGSRAHRKSDVVLITDGECAVPSAWREEFLARKRQRNFVLYSILVDVKTSRTDTIAALSDRISRVSDLEADTRKLFEPPRGRRAA